MNISLTTKLVPLKGTSLVVNVVVWWFGGLVVNYGLVVIQKSIDITWKSFMYMHGN